MPARIPLAIILAAFLALPAAASAQNPAGSAQAAPSPSQRQTLLQLQQQAARLTLVARLPEADRSQATQLLDRATALRNRGRALRIQELRAYVEALKAGAAPEVARVQAQQHVTDQRMALAKDMAAFRNEAEAFVKKVPQARWLLGSLLGGQRGHRCGAQGPGADRWPGPRSAPGMGRGTGPHTGPGMDWGMGLDRGWGMGPAMGRSMGCRMGPGMGFGMRPRENGPRMNRGRGSAMPWGWQQRNGPAGPNGSQNGTPQNSTPQNSTPSNGGGTGM